MYKRHFPLPKPLFPVFTTCSHLTWSNMPYILDKALPCFYAPQQSSMIYKDWKVAVNICYIVFTFTSDSTSKLTCTVRHIKENKLQIQKRPLDHYLTHIFEKRSYHYNLTHLSKEVNGATPVRMILHKYRKANSICGIFPNLSIYLCIMFWMRLRNTKSSAMKIPMSH